MRDIVIPKDNEDEFIALASRLGYDSLTFLYTYKEGPGFYSVLKEKEHSFCKKKYPITIGLLCTPQQIPTLSSQTYPLFLPSTSQDRSVIEGGKPCTIYGFELVSSKDHLHQRHSGLHPVLLRLMKHSSISYGLSYTLPYTLPLSQQKIVLGRIMQNAKLLRKHPISIILGSFTSNPYHLRSPHDIISLFQYLGFHPSEIKKAIHT